MINIFERLEIGLMKWDSKYHKPPTHISLTPEDYKTFSDEAKQLKSIELHTNIKTLLVAGFTLKILTTPTITSSKIYNTRNIIIL